MKSSNVSDDVIGGELKPTNHGARNNYIASIAVKFTRFAEDRLPSVLTRNSSTDLGKLSSTRSGEGIRFKDIGKYDSEKKKTFVAGSL